MGSRLEKNSDLVRKQIDSHTFENEEGDEYEGSKFGGFTDYFRRKKLKLQNLDAQVRSASIGKPQIFKGVSCHVNGYTQPSLNDLHHMIVSHGGGFMQYLDGKTTVTHIIASNLTLKKAIEFRQYRIVKPAWVVDSVKAGKLLPWSSYRVLDEGSGQRVLRFNDGKVVSQAGTQSRSYRDQTTTSWYTNQVKDVAEDIDDDSGAHFPSSQVVISNGTEIYTGSKHAFKSQKDTSNLQVSPNQTRREIPQSSGSFELSSSLEDALNDATRAEVAKKEQSSPNTQYEPLEESANISRPAAIISQATETDLLTMALESPTPEPSPRRPCPTTPSRASRLYLESPTNRNSHSHTPQRVLSKRTDFESPSPLRNHSEMRIRFESPSPVEKQIEKPTPFDTTSSIKKPAKVLSAEEHNAILLADPHIRKSSTGNPEFLKQYYSESRLHHLSTWKAELKAKCQQMASERSTSQRQSLVRKPGSRRYVLHVDFDSFFCAVSLKSAPEYVDKPTVVAHGSGSGSEIASCNYPARAFGIKNGMWMKNALKLCSNIKVLPYNFPAYEEASRGFYEAIIDVGGIIQSVSIDEALVDVSNLCLAASSRNGVEDEKEDVFHEQEKAKEIAQGLRDRIKEKTGCAVSVGIGGNILLAKVALRKAKPAGQYHIKPEGALDFLAELSVQDLPGVAHSIGGKLDEIGVKLVKDVRQLTKERLITVLGPKTGEKIWDYSRGIDRTEVGEQVARKSVSAEVNWGIRFISQSDAEEFVQNLCVELQRRLLNENVKGRQLTMKIMRKAADAPLDPPKNLGHGKCDTFSKSIVLGVATNSAEIIGREAVSILRSYGFSPGELRGLGVQMTKLDPIKTVNARLPDGSQRRINFGVVGPRSSKHMMEDPIDDPVTPKKQRSGLQSISPSVTEEDIDESPSRLKFRSITRPVARSNDPIYDSPQKRRVRQAHPAAAISRLNAMDNSAKNFLNITGTQFIIPSQVDPAVLAELPQDIRTKLMAQAKGRPESRSRSPEKSRSQSPEREEAQETSAPPLPSQLDLEVFESLPDDLKAEVLAAYTVNLPTSGAQRVLPQSPRKNRTIDSITFRKLTPKKRGRGRPPKVDLYSTKSQTNFVVPKKEIASSSKDQAADSDSDKPDPEFLSCLPPEMQEEVIAEHRRKRLAKKSGLKASANLTKRKPPEVLPQVQRKIRLPLRDPKPTFTTQELTTLPQLRETLKDWYDECSGEGPHEDDVKAIERYLKRVVVEEMDMTKVVAVVKWVEWLIEEAEESGGRDSWQSALNGIKQEVQEAVKSRGLGMLNI